MAFDSEGLPCKLVGLQRQESTVSLPKAATSTPGTVFRCLSCSSQGPNVSQLYAFYIFLHLSALQMYYFKNEVCWEQAAGCPHKIQCPQRLRLTFWHQHSFRAKSLALNFNCPYSRLPASEYSAVCCLLLFVLLFAGFAGL